jgi:hypothetical protein
MGSDVRVKKVIEEGGEACSGSIPPGGKRVVEKEQRVVFCDAVGRGGVRACPPCERRPGEQARGLSRRDADPLAYGGGAVDGPKGKRKPGVGRAGGGVDAGGCTLLSKPSEVYGRGVERGPARRPPDERGFEHEGGGGGAPAAFSGAGPCPGDFTPPPPCLGGGRVSCPPRFRGSRSPSSAGGSEGSQPPPFSGGFLSSAAGFDDGGGLAPGPRRGECVEGSGFTPPPPPHFRNFLSCAALLAPLEEEAPGAVSSQGQAPVILGGEESESLLSSYSERLRRQAASLVEAGVLLQTMRGLISEIGR